MAAEQARSASASRPATGAKPTDWPWLTLRAMDGSAIDSVAITWPSATLAMPWSDTTITLVVAARPRCCRPSSTWPTIRSARDGVGVLLRPGP
jgi:hypothetical protein